MRCSYCHRSLRLLDLRRPQRLLLPRCRLCRRYSLGLGHKAALLLCAGVVFYLLFAAFLTPPR